MKRYNHWFWHSKFMLFLYKFEGKLSSWLWQKMWKEKPKTYNQNVLAERAGDSGEDETDLSVIMDGVIEEQNHKIQLENLKREINYKWPTPQGQPSTWDLILKARKKAIETKKVRIEKQKEQAIKKKREDKIFWDKVLTAIWQTAIVLLIFGGIVWFISKNCKGC